MEMGVVQGSFLAFYSFLALETQHQNETSFYLGPVFVKYLPVPIARSTRKLPYYSHHWHFFGVVTYPHSSETLKNQAYR